jgi:branched-chain amino acid transport system substrate-binding protein
MLRRRHAFLAATALIAAATLALPPAASAADQVIKIGIDASLTGGDAHEAELVKNAALLAIEEANANHAVKGIKFEGWVLDDGTATAGQYDPAQAAINTRKFVSDAKVMGIVGPEMSGAAKAMAPIASYASLPIITESATNPALTDPANAAQYAPGKPIFFRTVATDAYQGPNLANYFADTLKVKTLYVLDDSGAYGEGIADAFQAQAEKKGIKVLGRDKLDPKAADYTAALTKIKELNPDALFYGGVLQAGVKVAKQAYDILPHTMIKAGGDGMVGADLFTGAGYPAAEGWYATQASPHVTEDKSISDWVAKYKAKFNAAPDDYSVTSYDATLVLIDAIKRVHATGKPITREAVRDAVASANVKTLQGMVAFDENGDIKDKVISIFQAHENKDKPIDDVDAQFRYIGVAPQA